MESRAKVAGHPAHPMLIVFPLGLLTTAVIFDVLHFITDKDGFAVASAYMIAAGIIGGVVASVFGLVDWLAIPSGTRAKRIGTLHGLGNAVVLVLFVVSWLLRSGEGWAVTTPAFLFGLVGVLLAGGTGWLGGELVDRLGVGVDDGAHLNAPSALSRRPASAGPQVNPTTR
jgi:uncharacterized membrane protein